MAIPQRKEYTIEDIYNLPDGTRAELIDGQIYYMAPPNTKHQIISSFLHLRIGRYIEDNKGSCKVLTAPFAVYLNGNESEYFEPDISVIFDRDKLDDKGCKGAPDWIIEITSPSNPGHDYITKLYKYRAAGVREYWIVNPQSQIITVYLFNETDIFPQNYTLQDKVKVNIYDDLTINFSKLDI